MIEQLLQIFQAENVQPPLPQPQQAFLQVQAAHASQAAQTAQSAQAAQVAQNEDDWTPQSV